MEINKKNLESLNNDKPFTEEESSFDYKEWLAIFFHYWYLFVIGLILSLGIAYLQNRKFIPTYYSSGTLIINESKNNYTGTQALMEGFKVDDGMRNINNQIIILRSNDLITKVFDSLPNFFIDYISQGNFKTRNLYKNSPVFIKADYVAPEAYNIYFKISINPNGTFEITAEDNKMYEDFKISAKFGQTIQHNLFFISVSKNYTLNEKREIYFRFRSRESLVMEFTTRLRFNPRINDSNVLEVGLESETPERDVDFLNALFNTYLADNLEKKNIVAIRTMEFIDNQLSNVSKSLEVSKDEMTSFRQRNQIVDVSSHSSELIGKATGYDTEMSNIRLKENYLDYLTKYLKTNMEDGTVVAPSGLGLNEPMLMALVQQINELHVKRSEVTEKNMFYAKYTREIENIKIAINEVVKNMKVALEIEKNDINNRYSKVRQDIRRLPQIEVELSGIDRKYKMDDSYYTFFLQKRAEAQILKASNTPDNQILDKARTKGATNTDKRTKTTLIFFALGLVIPAIIVILIELLNNTIHSVKDVIKNSPFQLIGMVRHTNSNDPLLVAKNPRSAFTEMFRVIRTRIEFIAQRKKNIMIMITSGESGDGKTYFCTNLACIYGMASPKTVLVDMDIRKPSIIQRFNIQQTNGVTNFFINECTLDDIIIKMPDVDFDFIPSGAVPPNCGELIRSEKLVDMFRELRSRYDYIIVDTSPIGIVADAYALAMQADVNLFIVRNEKTNKSFYKKLTAQLKLDNVPNLYTVINDISLDVTSYYSSYYSRSNNYGYGYGYAYGGYTYGYTSKRKRKEMANYHKYYQDDKDL